MNEFLSNLKLIYGPSASIFSIHLSFPNFVAISIAIWLGGFFKLEEKRKHGTAKSPKFEGGISTFISPLYPYFFKIFFKFAIISFLA